MQEEKEAQASRLVLQVELPTFPHTVVYQQAATAPQAPSDLVASSGERTSPSLQVIADPEVRVLRTHLAFLHAFLTSSYFCIDACYFLDVKL